MSESQARGGLLEYAAVLWAALPPQAAATATGTRSVPRRPVEVAVTSERVASVPDPRAARGRRMQA